MVERVETGGLMSFDYSRSGGSKLDDDEKREIDEAYARAEERKQKERRNRIILWVVVALIVLGVVGFVIY